MVLDLAKYLTALDQAGTFEEIQQLVVRLRDAFGVDHVVYHWVSADGEQYGFGTYDPIWVQRYIEREYIRIDPVVVGCLQHFHPVDWRQLDWTARAARAFREDALAHGVGNQGFSFPVRGPHGQLALLTVSHHCDDETWDKCMAVHKNDVVLIGHYLNGKAMEIAAQRAPQPVRQLSPREIETLTYLGMGHSRANVSELMHISEHTLRVYIESARVKLGATNTTHAIARAVSEGLIVIGGAARSAQGDWPGREGEQIVKSGKG